MNEAISKADGPWVFDATLEDFSETVLQTSHTAPVLVDFWADWCGPCLALAPVLHKIIDEFQGAVHLAKVDADENMKLCGRYGLRGFPTVLLFVNGEEAGRFTGAHPAHYVREFLARHLG